MDKDKVIIGEYAKKIVSHYEKNKIPLHELLNFPMGCCGLFVNVFQKYLLDKGYENVIRVSGVDENMWSHSWLEYKGIIIDLTINQFGNNYKEFLFKRDMPFYNKYRVVDRQANPALRREDKAILDDLEKILN